jgi:uncharacterized protein (UPF0332 family)
MPTAKFKGRDLKPHKAAVGAVFGAKTVLTNSPWEFVSLWLRREGHDEAGFYWNQARVFHQASASLPVESAPLLLYYSFMNAVKALLHSRGVAFNAHHGVRVHNMRGASRRITLSNEGVYIQNNNHIAPTVATYLGDTEPTRNHSLQQIFYNLSFIHRTYCLTYTSQADLFLPLVECVYFFDPGAHAVFFRAKLSKDYVGQRFIHRLPPTFVADPVADGATIRSAASVPVARRIVREGAELTALTNLHMQLRADLHYINGSQTLWYVKGTGGNPGRLARSPIVLTLAAMHRLSEICRYRPIELSAFLRGQQNWLLSEFIQMAPIQFVDEIASEITGYQFMTPNTRPAA